MIIKNVKTAYLGPSSPVASELFKSCIIWFGKPSKLTTKSWDSLIVLKLSSVTFDVM